jgi:hypothetical protein
MKRHTLSFAVAALLAFGVGTASAQRPNQDTGPSRPSDPSGGRGVAGRAGGGDTAPTSSTVGTQTSSGGGSSISNSTPSTPSTGGGGNAVGWGDRPGLDFPRTDAPRRGPGAARSASFSDDGGQRPRGGAPSSGTASPRGTPSGGGSGGSGGGSSAGRAAPRGGGGDSVRGGGGRSTPSIDGGGRDSNGPQRSAVPRYSRPREGRTAIGSPVERGEAIGRPGGIGVNLPWWYYSSFYGYPYGSYGYYNRYGWYPGYGFGLGYFYDPFWYGYGGYGGYPYGGYGGGSGYYRSQGYDTGNLRLKVQPRDAKVYVDGYFVGVVDSFDGVFQKLAIEAGTHRIEIRADGFEPAQFEVMVTPGETITYKGQLKPSTP